MDMCTKRVRPGQTLRLSRPGTLMCCAGTVWIAREAGPGGVPLVAGERYAFDGAGVLLIRAHEGMKDEWLNDTSFIVVSLSSAVAPQML
jgi:hypothetical protein